MATPLQYQVISDPSASRCWGALLINRLKRGEQTFAPFFCYTCPHSGREWLRRSSRNIAAPSFQPGFAEALDAVFSPAVTRRGLTIVDLGIGDLVRISPVLSMTLDSGTLRHCVMVDINRDLLNNVRTTSNPLVCSLTRRIEHSGLVTMLHCDYRFLRRYRYLLNGSGLTCLVMLGNTLGIELHPARVLRRLRQALRSGDQIVLELQATEPDGLNDEELTEYFLRNFEFYVGPLLSLGVPREVLELQARTRLGVNGTETVFVDALLTSEVRIDENAILSPGRYTFMTINKFSEAGIKQLVAGAGLTIQRLFRSGSTAKDRQIRPFYYVNAAVSE